MSVRGFAGLMLVVLAVPATVLYLVVHEIHGKALVEAATPAPIPTMSAEATFKAKQLCRELGAAQMEEDGGVVWARYCYSSVLNTCIYEETRPGHGGEPSLSFTTDLSTNEPLVGLAVWKHQYDDARRDFRKQSDALFASCAK